MCPRHAAWSPHCPGPHRSHPSLSIWTLLGPKPRSSPAAWPGCIPTLWNFGNSFREIVCFKCFWWSLWQTVESVEEDRTCTRPKNLCFCLCLGPQPGRANSSRPIGCDKRPFQPHTHTPNTSCLEIASWFSGNHRPTEMSFVLIIALHFFRGMFVNFKC